MKALGLAVLALATASLYYFLRLAALACAYKAKALCSALFVSGRDIDPERAPEVSADSYRAMRLFPAAVDRSARTVTVSVLGLQPRTALFRPGMGATLLNGPLSPAAIDPTQKASPLPWPAAAAPGLEPWLDAAFSEPDPRRLRRTRAVLVVRDGRILAERYAPGFSAATPLPGWSMTKSVIGALVGVLVGQGRLRLDQKELLPEWRGPGDPRSGISLEDLLRMRGGLRFSEKYSSPFSDVNRMLFFEGDAAAFAASRPLAHSPGAHWSYSSGTTNILSRLIRETVGESAYHSFPRRALFDPLGMSSAVLEPDAAGTFVGSSFLQATARDWARFGWLHARDGVWEGGRVLPEGWVKFCATPTPQAADGCYGAHWCLKLTKELGGGSPAAQTIPADALFALGHEGQTLTVIPSRRLVVVRLGLSIYIDAWDQAAFISRLVEALPA